MKKYLMTGIAALAMCFGFTSCSHDIEPASQEDLNNLEAEQIVNAYNQAFIKTFGQPAANQDWGFGTSVTRSIDVNGNLWKDCPEVGTKEEDDVLTYLSSLQTKEKNPVRLQNYFVTQIHKGEEPYYNKDGGYVGVGSDKMNHLQIAMSEGLTINNGALSATGPTAWDHINNFNAGTCDDWGAGDDDGEGNTLVLNGGTFDFAYLGSEDSKYHNRWCSIDGANVPRTDGKGANYAGYYYICFDFEQDVTAHTVIKFKDPSGTPLQGYVKGAFDKTLGTDQVNGMTVYYSEWDAEAGKNVEHTFEWTVGQTGTSAWELDNILNGNQMVDPNSSYKDWIIRLVKAERENEPDDYDVRIIAEDLNATATDGDIENSDWDFNDVVFDVNFTSDDAAVITLVAAGGTLPLIVGVENPTDNTDYPAYEVHNLFGVAVNYMVNTNAEKKNLNGGAPAVGHEAPTINFTKTGVKASNGNLIPIHVQKTLKDGTKKWFELTARRGQPAAKLAVNSKSTKFSICDEREDITKKYTNFKSWVVNNDPLIWWE